MIGILFVKNTKHVHHFGALMDDLMNGFISCILHIFSVMDCLILLIEMIYFVRRSSVISDKEITWSV